MLETFISPLQVEYFRYCTGVQFQPWFPLEIRCFMCHTGVLECMTPTNSHLKKTSSVHKITNVDGGVPRLERLVRLSSKKSEQKF